MALQIKMIDFQVSYMRDEFSIQMYGLDENRKTYSITVNHFNPFLYILVSNEWSKSKTDDFIEHFKQHENKSISKGAEDIVSYEWVKKKTLYGFDANKYYNFVYISCKNMSFIHKLKSLYYDRDTQTLNEGYLYNQFYTKIYECMIPPLLRFFHIQKISPSGWVKISKYKKYTTKRTHMDMDIGCDYKDVIAMDKDDPVPYKICSFDIEANSSHGDFPEASKDYKKVAYDIVYYLNDANTEDYNYLLRELLENIFGIKDTLPIDKCYPIQTYTYKPFEQNIADLYKKKISTTKDTEHKLQKYFCSEEEQIKIKKIKQADVITMLIDSSIDNPNKIAHLITLLDSVFPELAGDQVTFIGSTFVNYCEEKPYLNHCICLNDTSNILENQTIECYDTEKEVLCAWSKLIRKEDPDIIIGYNIFGFDYPFMFERANQLDCLTEFMTLGRHKEQSCELIETSIVLASCPFELKLLPMSGRLQIDLYTYMRKEYSLPSYKLDYVSSYLISDKVTRYENTDDTSMIYTKNMKGLELYSYVHFELHNH